MHEASSTGYLKDVSLQSTFLFGIVLEREQYFHDHLGRRVSLLVGKGREGAI